MRFFGNVGRWINRALLPPSRPGLPSPANGLYLAGSGVPAAPIVVAPAAPSPAVAARARRMRIQEAFDASMPVVSPDGLAGRAAELERLAGGVIEERKHGVVYGGRGSGKTSLARVFGDMADSAGLVVIYHSASGDIGFTPLIRPYLEELARELPNARSLVAAASADTLSARDVAGILAELTYPAVLVLDEFDRVESNSTKSELAALMKLLSDMRAEVRILVVGIASDLTDLIESHPSLLRHVVSVPVLGISHKTLADLLIRCGDKAGIGFTADAVERIARAAICSPYHLRLFGLHSALRAQVQDASEVDEPIAREGLQAAFEDWRSMTPVDVGTLQKLIDTRSDLAASIAAAADIAAHRTGFDLAELASKISEMSAIDHSAATALAARTHAMLKDVLLPLPRTQRFVFRDGLMPQFYLTMFAGLVDAGHAEEPRRPAPWLEQGVTSA